ncbi:hypothetical protein [Burkholderia vietnamiensis]|uniref:Pectate lyase superfamily protein domain-containing protein n=1 Tax=Burkholderia vietnamiensis TaxID=60552 RepID=A0ABS1AVN0_BURVI|nr:hypothetical protein [Burkholderia vietnamiensis]MBJ9688152.1 hypothetical protein [Burkholderia vietnamiensis]HDR8919953.1 hypothetical protein [Burkholderia vietnamiensis]HDR8978183.1 hypothetical protein [Burkholderia vietnamiensis]HDR9063076.1 hypothetical protein [Burkholderia vietnamiensis]HDR9081022.1 hypothetical protein [Burkholderia vietnamiensis]
MEASRRRVIKALTAAAALAASGTTCADPTAPGRDIAPPTADDVSPMQFNARGDGVADDTEALQRWIRYIVGNRKRGTLGARTYRISAPIEFPAGYSWAIDGDIAGGTKIVQTTANVPIFNIGTTGATPAMHSWRISNIEFDYANEQPASNENASPILFSEMVFEFALLNLRFARGSYAIRVKPGVGGPWGGQWDGLQFTRGLTGGAMQWTGCKNAVPNNKWGRLFVDAANMVGPVFKDIRGYNWVVDTIEIIAAFQGAQLMSIQAGSVCSIGALKLENGIYRRKGALVGIETGAHIKIDQFNIGGNNMVLHPQDGPLTLFSTAIGGPTGSFELNTLVAAATDFGGNIYVIGGFGGPMRIRGMTFDSHAWQICDNASTATGDSLTIDQFKNDRITANLGDRDYSVSLGDPNILSFESMLTKSRTLELPSAADRMFSGLYYDIRLYGAINGTNVLTIKSSRKILFVAKNDRFLIRFVWRRNAVGENGWVMVRYEVLP